LEEAAAAEGVPAQPGLRRAVTSAEEEADKAPGTAGGNGAEAIEEIPVPGTNGTAASDDR
jgi:hypothetical protein